MNTSLTKQIKDISGGVLTNTTDFVLFFLAFGIGLSKSAYSSRGVHQAAQWAEGMTLDRIKRAITHLRSKGWIKRDLEVTIDGQERLETFIPKARGYPRRWGGIWYLVSFDIPEKMAWKRNNFRNALLRMGFGKLHASLWISPYDFLGDVQEYCKTDHLDHYVILATSKEVGTQMSQGLADQVWNLEELNQGYSEWIEKYKEWSDNPQQQFELIFSYSALLQSDPFLAKPLLPKPWYGDIAHKMFKKLAPLDVVVEEKR